MENHRDMELDSPSSDPKGLSPSSPSASVLVAAQQLLELSATKSIVHSVWGKDGKLSSPPAMNGFVKPHPHSLTNHRVGLGPMNGDVSGDLCSVEEEEGEGEGEGGGVESRDHELSSSVSDNGTARVPVVGPVSSPTLRSPRKLQEEEEEEDMEVESEDPPLGEGGLYWVWGEGISIRYGEMRIFIRYGERGCGVKPPLGMCDCGEGLRLIPSE